jgi:hypothetical protein
VYECRGPRTARQNCVVLLGYFVIEPHVPCLAGYREVVRTQCLPGYEGATATSGTGRRLLTFTLISFLALSMWATVVALVFAHG